MSLVYYCSKCAVKISYLTEKPKNCPKCNYSFGGALEGATKRAEALAGQHVVAGKTKHDELLNEESWDDTDEKELQRLKKLEKLKKRKKYHPVPVRRFAAEDEIEEADAGKDGGDDSNLEPEDEEIVDPRAKRQLKKQFLQTLGGEGFRVEGTNESTTLRSILKEGNQ